LRRFPRKIAGRRVFDPDKLARVAGQFITANGNQVYPVQINGRKVFVTIPED
jgi:hypothetical protein